MHSRALSPIKLSICAFSVLVCLPKLASSQVSLPIEGFSSGNLAGQGGWTNTGVLSSPNVTIDNLLFSPMDGSTQSVRLRGNNAFQDVSFSLGKTINSGIYDFSYDLLVTNRTVSNLVCRVAIDSPSQEIFVPYAQDGGLGIAQNGRTDIDGLGSSPYGFTGGLISDSFRYQANKWYRFQFTMNFDQAIISNLVGYDISSGSPVLVGKSSTNFYFNNNGTSYYKDFNRVRLIMDPVTSSEGWNFDNFKISPSSAPEPCSILLVSIGIPLLFFSKRFFS